MIFILKGNNMDSLKSTNYILNLIEDGELICKEDIIRIYALDDEGIKSVFGEPDFKYGLRFAGSDYWSREHVKLMVQSKGF